MGGLSLPDLPLHLRTPLSFRPSLQGGRPEGQGDGEEDGASGRLRGVPQVVYRRPLQRRGGREAVGGDRGPDGRVRRSVHRPVQTGGLSSCSVLGRGPSDSGRVGGGGGALRAGPSGGGEPPHPLRARPGEEHHLHVRRRRPRGPLCDLAGGLRGDQGRAARGETQRQDARRPRRLAGEVLQEDGLRVAGAPLALGCIRPLGVCVSSIWI
mmetsp:Transcript_66312/g.149737  ORF Transcript_66312/g.149737 Transcript_66312/m.149737 type:complete len:210 (-) Transcript_66312:179-808(-)